MSTRRELLTKAPVLFIPALVSPGSLLAQDEQRIQRPRLSKAVVNSVSSTMSMTAAKIHTGVLARGDLSSAINAMSLLKDHFTEIGADAAMIEVAKRAKPYEVNLSESSTAVEVHRRLSVDDPSFSLPEVRNLLARSTSEESKQKAMNALATGGITPALAGAIDSLKSRLPNLPVSLPVWPGYGHLVRASTMCDQLNFYNGLLSTAAAELALGCLPDNPIFLEICGAILAIGIMVAVVSLLIFIGC